ncbi:hypothetical protein [Natronorubrum aibiense]|uniref:Uncharacterized protein n=1 Tax=Natronorubrum aibiense TaxID=348826 RepID=A0A5P9P0J4_9EURY|nr:hypothetical protein [Natronorubrum aibiense]QFU81671.1 hypothetical protein GCU68_03390 [Natronorubrum aibiense]
MSGTDRGAVIAVVGGAMVVVAGLLSLSTARDLLNGDMMALKPGWIDFAVAYPTVFAVLIVLLTLVFGGSFVALLDAA